MLTSIFDRITRLSIRFRYILLMAALAVMVAGIFGMTNLNLELLPRIEFPQTFVAIQWPDAESPDQFLREITIPLEDGLQEIDGVVNVESTTSSTFAFLVVRNEFGLNQDDIVESINELINNTPLPEGVETPQVLNFSLSDLPIVVASASSQQLQLNELKDLVINDLQPLLEDRAGVANVAVSGGQELPPEVEASANIGEPLANGSSPEVELRTRLVDREEDVSGKVHANVLAKPAGQESQVEPVELPDSWIAAGQQVGMELETTADITADVMSGIITFAPDLLSELTPSMWRVIDPAAVAVALPAVEDQLGDELLAQLAAIQRATNRESAEPSALPESWVETAAGFGISLETTADIVPEAVGPLASSAPELLGDLTPEMILAFTPEVQAALPEEYLATLDEDLQETLRIVSVYASAAPTDEGATGESDPTRLPDVLIQGASAFGVELEFASDIEPDFMRQIGALGPQGNQILQLLTPDHLKAMPPETIALLPQGFVSELDPALKDELDELSSDFGGAGALAAAEAEENAAAASEAAESAPALNGVWIAPGPNGEPSQFQTAFDILENNFLPSAAQFLNIFPDSPQVDDPREWISALTPEIMGYLIENEEDFVQNLSPIVLEMMSPETLSYLLEVEPEAFDADLAERLQGIAAGTVTAFVPEASVTRTDGNPSLLLSIYKSGDANTVEVAHEVFDVLDDYSAQHPDVSFNLAFEQAGFIEESIAGVSREGVLGALFAVIVILIFLSGRVGGKFKPSWRATIVVGVSIPLSVLTAFLLMWSVPPTIGVWIHDLADNSGNGILTFISRLFPRSVTLNIMTLSGLTVAVGRVVDDSIVVLENIYRFIQKGDDAKRAVIEGTREVAIAIFASTATTVAVFLPLGLLGGIIGSFFLPFGLTVTYALAASFFVAITIVPALAFLLIRKEHIPDEQETAMQKWYTPILTWSLSHRGPTMLIATVIFLASLFLVSQLPQSFIPELGEPTVNTVVSLPNGTLMAETDDLTRAFESRISTLNGIDVVQTEVGSQGGVESFFGGSNVSQNAANVTVSVKDQDELDNLTVEVRDAAEEIFGADNVVVSAASQTGFAGFSLVVTGSSMEELGPVVEDIKGALSSIDHDNDGRPDIVNVSSNVDQTVGGNENSIIRIDGQPAISFDGELETENTLGVTAAAKEAVTELESLPPSASVTEGFESEQQTEGFRQMVTAIGYSILIVYVIMATSFGSLIHPFTILFSLPFALVGASLALVLTGSVLGISAMVGLMMLVGIVVTNAIVLMELVQQIRKRGAPSREALIQAGRTRLRPIWMTALAAALALLPMALSLEFHLGWPLVSLGEGSGAIIAKELAITVIGGLLVSTALTLIVVPVVYSLFDQVGGRLRGSRRKAA